MTDDNNNTNRVHTYESHWHLDKRVPLALIFTLIGQLALGLIVGTMIWAQVTVNTKDISDLKLVMPVLHRMVVSTEGMAEDIGELKDTIKDLAKEMRDNNNRN